MTVTRARLAKLEAQRWTQRRGCLVVRDQGTGELAEFVATSRDSAGERWQQRRGESLDALADRIEAEAGVRWLIMFTHPDRPVRCDFELQRPYAQAATPDRGRRGRA